VVVLSHFGMGVFFMLAHLLRGDVVPLDDPVAIFVLGVVTLTFLGWLTIPLGAGCGALAWYVRRWWLTSR
jgi:hypothetical protein